jgi:PKD repeat protein
MIRFSLCLLASLLLFALPNVAQVIVTESFDATTFPPIGWSIKPSISSPEVWVRQATGITNPTTTPHSGAALARFRSRFVAAGTKQVLISRAVDYTDRGTNNASVSFWMYRDNSLSGNADSVSLYVNTTDTLDTTAVLLGTIARNRTIAIPDVQTTTGWYLYSFQVPLSFASGSVYFLFQGSSETAVVNQGANTYIDDVSFDEFPPNCTGTPNIGLITNPLPLSCNGTGSTTLGLTTPIGNVLGISYTWEESLSSGGPWSVFSTNAPNLNTGVITSTTYYRCTATCSFSGLSYTTPVDSIMILPNPLPTVTITPSSATFCTGSAGTELIATGAVTYLWSPAAGLNTTTDDTVVATPSAITTYVVMGTDADGCTNTATATITVSAPPNVNLTANPNDTVCVGTEIILTSLPTGATGNVYVWSTGNTFRRDTLVLTSDSVIWVQATTAAGCTASDTISLFTIPASVANFGYTNTGNTFVFSDSSSTATGWLWTFGDGNGSSLQNPTYTYSAPGTYTVTLVISGTGCNDDSISKVIIIGPQGIDENIQNNLAAIYPNPVDDVMIIQSALGNIESVDLMNTVGQKLQHISDVNQSQLSFSTIHLKPGIYFVRVRIDNQVQTIRIIRN